MALGPAATLGQLFRDPRRILVRLGIFAAVSLVLILATRSSWLTEWLSDDWSLLSEGELVNITQAAKHFSDHPVKAPYKDQFWEVGQRSRYLGRWLSQADGLRGRSKARRDLLEVTETTAQKLFPFLRKPVRNPDSESPLADLRSSFDKGSRGIVIPVGGGEQSVRFAGHLLVSIRRVLQSDLPIQIAYAGEDDLPEASRNILSNLEGVKDLEFLDVFTVFDDYALKLKEGGWAIKAFALLASRFEQVILLDADAVFLQKPDVLFDQQAYINKGAYLFHDRLLWQHAFRSRHDWWEDQIKEPSAEMNNSLVWTQDYAEECDSGVVVADKSRVDILVGLLHVAWQNTLAVREEVTYKLTHGDKESWWLGLELAGSTYEFEQHYGSMIGWAERDSKQNVTRVCSFVIAHIDENERVIWYNGSLLKNKRIDLEGYEVPEYWMVDGKWHKGRTKDDMSCMSDSEPVALTEEEKRVLSESIERARVVDAILDGQH